MDWRFFLDDTALLVFAVWLRMSFHHIARLDNGPVFSGKTLMTLPVLPLYVAANDLHRIIFSQPQWHNDSSLDIKELLAQAKRSS